MFVSMELKESMERIISREIDVANLRRFVLEVPRFTAIDLRSMVASFHVKST